MGLPRILTAIKGPFLRVVLITFITFFLSESALRIYNHYIPSFVFFSQSYNRFRGKPFAQEWDFRLNSGGFNDTEFSDKRDTTYRIVGIGDSFAFGVVPYRYNYLTLLESQLFRTHADVEVLNLGIPSIGPKEYVSILIHEGLELQPDMVLLSFFIGNDIKHSKPKAWYEFSYVLQLLKLLLHLQTQYEGRIIHGDATYCDECPNLSPERFREIEAERSRMYVKGDPDFPKGLAGALSYLRHIKAICEQRHIDFVVVLIPDEVQINLELQREVRGVSYPHIAEEDWNITYPNTVLAQQLAAMHIDFLDLYPHFAKAGPQQFYRLRDTHWNIAGNQLAADILTSYLTPYLPPPTEQRLPSP